MAVAGEPLGLIAVADVLRPEAPAAVAALRELGVEVIMLSGDAQSTAAAIALQETVTFQLAQVVAIGEAAVLDRQRTRGADDVAIERIAAQLDVALALGDQVPDHDALGIGLETRALFLRGHGARRLALVAWFHEDAIRRTRVRTALKAMPDQMGPLQGPLLTEQDPLAQGEPDLRVLRREGDMLDELLPHFRSTCFNVGCDETFDIVGWNSSYTGQPIPEEEMREWVDQTVERILSLRPKRVLEIGCGTGLLTLALLRSLHFPVNITALDLSATSIRAGVPPVSISRVR